ncbi:TonB-dependent receptor [Luteibaculum oceani]|uniref:TonB-dependent receptor n=1 Tax=Luteibaculum oceani TaxID=1294296 RepID=A0A5C6VE72_9FLAO|nr:carboxypeptidase-like regulatory domain-containing protein [Luteibaculum oceani]TXC81358.1 TonB-dependent receptor [Luteibaculum oceani]
MRGFITLVFALSICLITNGQYKVSGVVKDARSKETLIGAAVIIKGKSSGVTTDIDGNFELNIPGNAPTVIMVSYLGYQPQEKTVSPSNNKVDFLLETNQVVMKEVKIVGQRVEEKLREAPVTIERMGIKEIKQTPAAGFYEGLANLKGVDMTSASLGFKVINTRGFNSTSPVRTIQLIDGVDNQAPGLNFSLGNFVGVSELDVEKVDIVVGANSATYGPNAFNGVISMTTKDPYKYEGLELQVKGAERNFAEIAMRYAHVSGELNEDGTDELQNALARFNNKVLKDRFAYKFNAYYLTADDWEATNYDTTLGVKEVLDSEIKTSAEGYDAINIYGESLYGSRTAVYNPAILPGTVGRTAVYRTGYREEDLTNYETYSLKLSGAAYYKLPENFGTVSYWQNYALGTTVYQGDNRYSVKDITFRQQKLEWDHKNFNIKAYQTKEDAGNSYDLVFTAQQLLRRQKEDFRWFNDYTRGYREAYRDSGYSVQQSFEYARAFANSETNNGGKYLVPGTPEFEAEFNKITSNPSFQDGGTRFADASSLKHIEFKTNFDLTKIKSWLPETFKFGGNYRLYDPNSFGTIFSDTLIDRNDISKGFVDISVWEYGAFTNFEKDVTTLEKSKVGVKLIGSLRYDNHQNFDPFFTPALSAVISTSNTDNIRLTYTTARRNPTLQDQYLLYDIGVARLKGNINGEAIVSLENYFDPEDGYLATGRPKVETIAPVRPERVETFEIGYKGIMFRNLYVDASYYQSKYNDFLGYIIAFDFNDSTQVQGGTYVYDIDSKPTRFAANSISTVETQGFSVGLNYYFPQYFSINGNYTWSKLTKTNEDDPLIPFFNTPEHKFNIGVGLRGWKNFGANITYRWVEGFDYFGSPQFSGPVPTYGLVDAQVNYEIPDYNLTFKLGASNILNNLHFEAYGAPFIGRLAYFSVNYGFNKNGK